MEKEKKSQRQLRRIRDLRQSLGKGACGIGEIRDGKMNAYPVEFGKCVSCNQSLLGEPGAECDDCDAHAGYWNIDDTQVTGNVEN